MWALAALSCVETVGPDGEASRCRISLGDAPLSPTIDRFSVSDCPVDPSGGEVTVDFTLAARASDAEIAGAFVTGRTPGGVTPNCRVTAPISGTSRHGVWSCSWVLNRYAEPGVYEVRAEVWDAAGSRDTAQASLDVVNPLPDTTPPVLVDIAYADEETIVGGEATRALVISGTDSESGMWWVEVFGDQDRPMPIGRAGPRQGCGHPAPLPSPTCGDR